MIIIDNISPKSPILEWKPIPLFRTEYERSKWYAEEKKRSLEGYNGIPGTLYHKTMHQMIKNRNTGEMLHPICRDGDLLIHSEMEEAKKAGEATLIMKGRGFGLSCDGGCLVNYYMTQYPGSTSFVTSSEFPKIQALFTENITSVYESYEEGMKPPPLNYNKSSKNVYLSVEVKHKDKDGREKLSMSQVFLKETADSDSSASGFSGRGAAFGFFDESGLHKRIEMLLRSSAGCFRDGNTKKVVGSLLLGGVVEPNLSNEQIATYQKFVEKARDNKFAIPIRTVFVPFWMGMFMENGHSNRKLAEKWWNDEYERVKDNPAELRSHMMQYPRTEDDIFQLTAGDAYEEDVSDMLISVRENLVNNPPVIQKCKLVRVGDKIQTAPSKEPNNFILENPKPNIQYVQLIDGTGTGKKTGNQDGSNVASIICKLFDPQGGSYTPVGIYYERPQTVEQSYINMVNQFRYFNIHGGMDKICAEGNMGASDHFSTFLEKEGLGKYIQMRKDLSGKGNVEKNKPFQYIGVDELNFQYRFMNIFLRKYGHELKFIMLIDDMLTPKSENADMRSAFNMLSIALPTNFDKPVVHQKPLSKGRYVVVVKNGQTQWEWTGDKPQQQIRGIAEQLQQ